MKELSKTICDFSKKDIAKYEKYLKITNSKPKYICNKCFRASPEKEFLCKPKKI